MFYDHTSQWYAIAVVALLEIVVFIVVTSSASVAAPVKYDHASFWLSSNLARFYCCIIGDIFIVWLLVMICYDQRRKHQSQNLIPPSPLL